MPRLIKNQAKPFAKRPTSDRPVRSLRTCFLGTLMFGLNGSPLALGQVGTAEPFIVQPELPGTSAVVSPSPNAASRSEFFQPPVDYSVQVLPGSEYPYPSAPAVSSGELLPHPLDQSVLVSGDDQRIKMLEPEDELPMKFDLYDLSIARYTSYRSEEAAIAYMPGDGDQFGWLSVVSPNYLNRDQQRGVTGNINIHLLSGPLSIHLPPRLYDFELGYQARNSLSELFSYEWSAMVGVYSDFEDSARDGVRFPAHAVGMFHPGPRADWVFGVDYLGRDDIKVLPVAGFVWHDPQRPELRYEMVFPRPRIDLTLSSQSRIYFSGLLGGGTWDIEFPGESNDVMTYRDYKMAFGIEHADSDGKLSSWELGWVFSRKLEFRNVSDEMGFGDAFVIRYVTAR